MASLGAHPPPASAPLALEDLIEPVRQRYDLPALAAAVVSGERLLALGATGVRKRGASEVITRDDRFHLGSCTKAMTATLCALLVQDGLLRWEQPIREVLGEGRSVHGGYEAATLEQLLTHHAGVPATIPSALWAELWDFSGDPSAARARLATGILERAPAAVPGTRFLYSNAGTALAGHLAELCVGQSFEDLLRDRLFGPLDMTTAGFGPPGAPGALLEPWGHRQDGSPVPPGPAADNPVAIAPAGRVHASIADWGRFIQLHLQGPRGASSLLSPEICARLHRPYPDHEIRYAGGWRVEERDWAGGRVLTHAGSNTLWHAVVWLAPTRDRALLVACNQGGSAAERACDEAIARLIGTAAFTAP